MPFGGKRATAQDMWASSRSRGSTHSCPAAARGGSRFRSIRSLPLSGSVGKSWLGGKPLRLFRLAVSTRRAR